MARKRPNGKCNSLFIPYTPVYPTTPCLGLKWGPHITVKLRARISRRKGTVTTEEPMDGSAVPEIQHIW